MVRSRGKAAHVLTQAIGLGNVAEGLLPLNFGGGTLGRVSAKSMNGISCSNVERECT